MRDDILTRMIGISHIVVTVLLGYTARLSPAAAAWPEPEVNIERALERASGAFLGTLELYDVSHESENVIMASGRVRAKESVWGALPVSPIELGRDTFMRAGSGRGIDQWMPLVYELERGRRSQSVLVVYRSTDAETETLYVVLDQEDALARARADVLRIRELEAAPATEELREQLQQAAVGADNSDMLWSYALRKLYRITENHEDRFECIFSEPLRRAGIAKRLQYAAELLLSNNFSQSVVRIGPDGVDGRKPARSVKWVVGGPADGRRLRSEFLEVFETASSQQVAYIALGAFLEQNPATRVEWTPDELAVIRGRIEATFSNPDHPIRDLEHRKAVVLENKLERFFEP